MCVCKLLQSCLIFATLWIVAHQVPLTMGFSRQEYWSGFPFPPPGDLPDPRIKPMSPVSPSLQMDSLPLSHWGRPGIWWILTLKKGQRAEQSEPGSRTVWEERGKVPLYGVWWAGVKNSHFILCHMESHWRIQTRKWHYLIYVFEDNRD